MRREIGRLVAPGHSRRFDCCLFSSGLPPETDILRPGRHVSKVPTSDIVGSTTSVAAHPLDRQKLSSKGPSN
jgi:hypothetical protein